MLELSRKKRAALASTGAGKYFYVGYFDQPF